LEPSNPPTVSRRPISEVLIVAALAIGAALRPGFFDRLQQFDFAGINVELREMKTASSRPPDESVQAHDQ
jgi:hypothetical protein